MYLFFLAPASKIVWIVLSTFKVLKSFQHPSQYLFEADVIKRIPYSAQPLLKSSIF